jgi:hypothetical protein
MRLWLGMAMPLACSLQLPELLQDLLAAEAACVARQALNHEVGALCETAALQDSNCREGNAISILASGKRIGSVHLLPSRKAIIGQAVAILASGWSD